MKRPLLRTLYIVLLSLAVTMLFSPTVRTSVFSALRTATPKAFAIKTTPSILTRSFTTTNHLQQETMASQQFLDALKERRSIYTLSDKSPIPDKRIIDIVEQAIKHVPSSFNSQSTRALVLLKDEHKKLWDITSEILKPVVPADAWAATEGKMAAFRGGYGTVLFFEDQDSIKSLQDKFPLYQDRFPIWSDHSDGMHQLVVWTALTLEGFGANLQHYNPLIDQRVQTTWGIHPSWTLKGQLVFGTPTAGPGEKSFLPLEERIKVFGADA